MLLIYECGHCRRRFENRYENVPGHPDNLLLSECCGAWSRPIPQQQAELLAVKQYLSCQQTHQYVQVGSARAFVRICGRTEAFAHLDPDAEGRPVVVSTPYTPAETGEWDGWMRIEARMYDSYYDSYKEGV